MEQILFRLGRRSIVNAAKNGTAVIAKAAGNDAVAVGAAKNGQKDYFNIAMIGAR